MQEKVLPSAKSENVEDQCCRVVPLTRSQSAAFSCPPLGARRISSAEWSDGGRAFYLLAPSPLRPIEKPPLRRALVASGRAHRGSQPQLSTFHTQWSLSLHSPPPTILALTLLPLLLRSRRLLEREGGANYTEFIVMIKPALVCKMAGGSVVKNLF